eukprot:GCRY01000899.1.p1 GENE.GCRY01000899.1~~GCRY01000899.1.p1  ORF type:complete len:496 (-),score=89.82 GCRY01000899.1:316-1803(-)
MSGNNQQPRVPRENQQPGRIRFVDANVEHNYHQNSTNSHDDSSRSHFRSISQFSSRALAVNPSRRSAFRVRQDIEDDQSGSEYSYDSYDYDSGDESDTTEPHVGLPAQQLRDNPPPYGAAIEMNVVSPAPYPQSPSRQQRTRQPQLERRRDDLAAAEAGRHQNAPPVAPPRRHHRTAMPQRREVQGTKRETGVERRQRILKEKAAKESQLSKKERRMRDKEMKKRARLEREMQAIAMMEANAHSPVFINLITIVDLFLFAYSVYKNGGFEDWSVNPFYGPSVQTLLDMGAKYAPYILDGEWWRFFTAMFLHVGVIHIAMNLSFQIKAGSQLERDYGFLRIAPIYMMAGVAGNLASSIFLPAQVQVGASGSLYGLLGVLFSDLFQNWSILESPWGNLGSMVVTLAISLAMGLMPQVDNFAHVGGFICGVLTGIIFLPTIHFGWLNKTLTLIAMPALFIYFVTMFSVFYSSKSGEDWCSFCVKINCLDAYFDCDSVS